MASVVGSELYSQIAEIINDNLVELGMSIDDKKTKGKNIYIQCEEDRLETQDKLEALFDDIPGVKSQILLVLNGDPQRLILFIRVVLRVE